MEGRIVETVALRGATLEVQEDETVVLGDAMLAEHDETVVLGDATFVKDEELS